VPFERRSVSTSCEDVRGHLAGVAAGEVVLPLGERDHVEHCLRCQAEVVQHRRILRSMRAMRAEVLEPAPGMLPDLLAGLHEVGERRAIRSLLHRRRIAYAVAISGLLVAGSTGTVVALRSHRSRPPQAVGS
jgi:hypothetical protein